MGEVSNFCKSETLVVERETVKCVFLGHKEHIYGIPMVFSFWGHWACHIHCREAEDQVPCTSCLSYHLCSIGVAAASITKNQNKLKSKGLATTCYVRLLITCTLVAY